MRYGSRRTLLRKNDCLAFVRAYFSDRVLVVLNRARTERNLSIDVPPELVGRELADLGKGDKVPSQDNRLSITVPPMSFAFIAAGGK